MSKWYVEKNGKFYGPFTTEKVREYRAKNKISDQTKIADNAAGAGALAFEAVSFEAQQTTSAKTRPKIGRTSTVRSKTNSQVSPGPKKTPTPKTAAKSVTPLPTRRQKPGPKATTTSKSTASVRPKGPLIAVYAAILLVIGAIAFIRFNPDARQSFNKFKAGLNAAQPLRGMIQKTETPNWNDMVVHAMSKALLLPINLIKQTHQTAIVRYEKAEGSPQLQQLLAQPIARELSYNVDAGFEYTYLFDQRNICFAVAVRGPNFPRVRKEHHQADSFAGSLVQERSFPDRVEWFTRVSSEVAVRAVWQTAPQGGHHLQYVIITAEPSTGGS